MRLYAVAALLLSSLHMGVTHVPHHPRGAPTLAFQHLPLLAGSVVSRTRVCPVEAPSRQMVKRTEARQAVQLSASDMQWPMSDEALAGLEQRDGIGTMQGEVEFMRASFGLCDDVQATVCRCDPIHADSELANADALKGKIAVVHRGSSTGQASSFVDKAKKVISAGAVAMIVVNNEDTLVAPGDSSHTGGSVMLPVVGIRNSDAARLRDGEEASIKYQPIVHLTQEQRKHLRALVIMREREGTLVSLALDRSVASEMLLDEIDEILVRDELVRLRLDENDEGGYEMQQAVLLAEIEDMVDLSTVLAENLGATVVQINARQFVLFRGGRDGGRISLPKDGEASELVKELSLSLGQLSGSIQVLLSDDTSVYDQMGTSPADVTDFTSSGR